MYWWYRILHVQQTLNYTNLTTAPKCKKPNLNLCMCAGVGVWVLLKSPFCVKHPIFTNIYISWDFDDLSTKTRHAPYNVWSSKHPPAGCTLDWNVIVTDQKDTLFLRMASPSPRNNWGPRCTFFPFIAFVKDSILGNWLQKRAPEARGKSSAKRECRRRESLPEAQEIPRSGETNSQFLALNSCKAHTSSISCSYLVCDTDYLLLCVGKFFFFTRPGQVFFFLPMWVKFFFPSMCGSSFFFFFLTFEWVKFFFTKTSCSPPWSLMVRPLIQHLGGFWLPSYFWKFWSKRPKNQVGQKLPFFE